MSNHIDFRLATDLTVPVAAIYDPDESREMGNALRYMLLEQLTPEKASVTAYLKGNAWACQYLTAHGIVGSKFLIDGEDLKTRVTGDVWNSNPMRLSPTTRNAVDLKCILSESNGLHPNIECTAYPGSLADLVIPELEWNPEVATVSNGWDLRKAIRYVLEFCKYQSDSHLTARTVWFKGTNGALQLYGPERGGACGISFIKTECEYWGKELDFGIQGRHLPKILNLFGEEMWLTIEHSVDNEFVKFSGAGGWLRVPLQDKFSSQTVSISAPAAMNDPQGLSRYSLRVYGLKTLSQAVAIQTPKKRAGSEDLILQCEDTYLLITKQADILQREKSYAVFATPDGMENPWQLVIANHKYLTPCLSVMAKFLKDYRQQQDYETGYEQDWDSEEVVDEDEIPDTDLVSITQAYSEAKKKWVLFIDPVPYSEGCRMMLSVKQPQDVTDRLEGE